MRLHCTKTRVFTFLLILKFPDPEPSKARCLAGAQFFEFFRKKNLVFFSIIFADMLYSV